MLRGVGVGVGVVIVLVDIGGLGPLLGGRVVFDLAFGFEALEGLPDGVHLGAEFFDDRDCHLGCSD